MPYVFSSGMPMSTPSVVITMFLLSFASLSSCYLGWVGVKRGLIEKHLERQGQSADGSEAVKAGWVYLLFAAMAAASAACIVYLWCKGRLY